MYNRHRLIRQNKKPNIFGRIRQGVELWLVLTQRLNGVCPEEMVELSGLAELTGAGYVILCYSTLCFNGECLCISLIQKFDTKQRC